MRLRSYFPQVAIEGPLVREHLSRDQQIERAGPGGHRSIAGRGHSECQGTEQGMYLGWLSAMGLTFP